MRICNRDNFYKRNYWELKCKGANLIYPVSLIIGFLLMSCGNSKASQCQKIFTIASNLAQKTQVLTISEKTETMESKNWLEAAKAMEKAAVELEKLKIVDPKLEEYKINLAKIYQTNSQATQAIVQAWQEKNITNAQKAQKNVREAGKEEKALGDSINNYCQIN